VYVEVHVRLDVHVHVDVHVDAPLSISELKQSKRASDLARALVLHPRANEQHSQLPTSRPKRRHCWSRARGGEAGQRRQRKLMRMLPPTPI